MLFPVGRRVLLFTEITVSAGSAAPGRTVGQLNEAGACRVLAMAPAAGEAWEWGHDDHELSGGERLAVAATRAGLARLLRSTKTVARA